MATFEKSKPSKILKIADEEFIDAGMLISVPNIEKNNAGPSERKKKYKLMKIDEKELAELRSEVAPCDLNTLFTKGVFKQTNNLNSQRKSSLLQIRKPISRRSSNGPKDIAEKAVKNIKIMSAKENRSNGKFNSKVSGITDPEDKPNIRKKLFQMCSSYKTQTKNKTEEKNWKVSRITKNYNSPLMDLNTAEKLMEKNSSLKLVKPICIVSESTPLRLSTVLEENQSLTPSEKGSTSNLDSDDNDFENMENLCEVEEKNDTISKILSMIKNAQEEFEKFQVQNQKRLSEISVLVQKLISDNVPNHNGKHSKKSISKPKLPKRTPLKNLINITESDNLRRNVLMKSIGKGTNETPKHKKAERMYNSMRDKYGILETPTFNKESSVRKSKSNISMKLQEQCLMLLDTPEHN